MTITCEILKKGHRMRNIMKEKENRRGRKSEGKTDTFPGPSISPKNREKQTAVAGYHELSINTQ